MLGILRSHSPELRERRQSRRDTALGYLDAGAVETLLTASEEAIVERKAMDILDEALAAARSIEDVETREGEPDFITEARATSSAPWPWPGASRIRRTGAPRRSATSLRRSTTWPRRGRRRSTSRAPYEPPATALMRLNSVPCSPNAAQIAGLSDAPRNFLRSHPVTGRRPLDDNGGSHWAASEVVAAALLSAKFAGTECPAGPTTSYVLAGVGRGQTEGLGWKDNAAAVPRIETDRVTGPRRHEHHRRKRNEPKRLRSDCPRC